MRCRVLKELTNLAVRGRNHRICDGMTMMIGCGSGVEIYCRDQIRCLWLGGLDH